MTGVDLISSSLRLIGAIEPGESPSADESNDGLLVLNQMIDAWLTERYLVFSTPRVVFNLVSGQQTYQLGTGAPDFNYPRPVKLERAGIINTANPQQPLELPLEMLTRDEWAKIPVKNIQSSLPRKLWVDYAFPFAQLNFWCIPNVAGLQTALYPWQQLSQFNDLVTDYQFPPGYAKALRYNLAVELAPEFNIADIPPLVLAGAASSKAKIKSINIPILDMACDAMLVSPDKKIYNYLTDGPVHGGSGGTA